MAIGNLKGDYILDPELRNNLIKEIESKDFVEKVGKFGNCGFWIKAKNLKYKTTGMPVRTVTPRLVPYEFGKTEKHYGENTFFIQTTCKYFHDMLEILPQIISLKQSGENFKIILAAAQPIDPETKNFYGMNRNDDKGYQPIHYWLDILKYFRLDYECIYVKPGEEFSADSSYLFYYTDAGAKFGLGFNSGPAHQRTRSSVPYLMKDLIFENAYIIFPLMYFTTWVHADAYDVLKNALRPLISKVIPGRKIFITRDSKTFADRSIENSERLTAYMKSQGFEIFNQEDYIWQEQIKKITSAEVVVSLVGSGFINASFCGPDTTMISIHTDKPQDFLVYANQAGRTDIDFKTIYCDADGIDIINYFKRSRSKITRKVIDDGTEQPRTED